MKAEVSDKSFLEFLPVSLFGGVMGLCGLSFCWRLAEKSWGIHPYFSNAAGVLAVLCFLILFVAYVIKIFRYPKLVIAEANHPVQICFFATFIVCLLLIPGITLPYLPVFSKVIWSAGALMIFIFALHVLRKWLDNKQQPESAMPIWILPVVGTLDVPVVGYHIGIPGVKEICLMFFGIGVLFGIILIVVVISRLFFQAPIPPELQATLLILTGPFALAYTGYIEIQGNQDIASATMFYFNIFLFLLISGKIMLLPISCPFKVSWWSVSFPLTAITVTCFHYANFSHYYIHKLMAGGMILLTTTVIIYLLFQTFFKISTRTFVPLTPSKS
ncbi:SLAC1 anion channel family protein [Pedobacter jamesrossensis]|uniref:SLAC1 anion channel family protein n=1 Tax=Pedobacter jamesrossensis TaxID=1908238 RepID=A0ABV8NM13_9SPHI